MIGRTISHYRIVSELGQGGRGIVYKARDLKLERDVALKFLHARYVESETEKARLIEEARAAAALDHPNICPIYEIDDAEGQTFLAMAYLEGPTLRDRLESGPLPALDAVRIGIQVARALEAAHAKGIVHRDVKCGNVIVGPDGHARLMDFGLAVRRTAEGVARDGGLGTPAFMAPEQLLREPLDARCDIWAWGVIFYQMLAGRLPFLGDSPRILVHGILHEDPPRLESLGLDLPEALQRVVDRTLAKRPDDRFADVRALLAELCTFERDHGGGAARTGPSVAVLPFRDMSRERDQRHFCEGIAGEIINDLACIAGLRVASRTSSFCCADTDADVREIGGRLGVSSVLEGSVRKAGDRLRIGVELTDVVDGMLVWSEQYDRKASDVFSIQQEIACSVADALRVQLTERELTGLGRKPTRDVEAYDYYLRGRQFFYRSHRKALGFALEMFGRATEIDPRYALAHAGMADCHSYRYMYFGGERADLLRAEEESRKALEIDPHLAEGHAARGLALSLCGRHDDAESEFREAIRLNPRLFEAYYFYARACYAQGRLADAALWFEEASRVNPDDFQSPSLLGFAYRGLNLPRRAEVAYLQALAKAERHARLNPDDARAIYLAGDALINLGRDEEGLERVTRALALEPEDPYIVYGVACAHALTGRATEAVRYLEQALAAGFAHREWLARDTDFDPIRETPEFLALMDRLGIRLEPRESHSDG